MRVKKTDFAKVKSKEGGFVKVKTLIFVAKADAAVTAGNIAFNLVQRKTLSLSVRGISHPSVNHAS
jgi:hypothetical protein